MDAQDDSNADETPTMTKFTGMSHSASLTGVADFDNQLIEAASNEAPPSPFEKFGYSNVASSSKGARILFSSDEWFAAAERLLDDSSPNFDPDAYCPQGKVMDGWESRRRREAGHDWSVIRLAKRAKIIGIEIDTAHFTGNNVPAISLEIADLTCSQETKMVCALPHSVERLLFGGRQGTGATPAEMKQAEEAVRAAGAWTELLPKTHLRPGYEGTRMHYFNLSDGKNSTGREDDDTFNDQAHPYSATVGTHVRVNYYPDGGVARLRLWGNELTRLGPKDRPLFTPIKTGRTCTVISHSEGELPSRMPYPYPELSSAELGGIGLVCSNKHYGDPWNLIQPTLGRDMGDGWETARHPSRPGFLVKDPETDLVDSPLSDWCIMKLGSVAGNGIERIILDTMHFRGNYPESTLVQGCYLENDDDLREHADWFTLLPRGRMAPDSEHVYERSKGQILNAGRKVSHIKVSIYPDGGLSRVRVYGQAGKQQ